jgi:hypothetical protein
LKNITDYHIELFIRYPEKLSPEERVQIKNHLDHSEEAQKIAEWFRQFYGLYDQERREEPTGIIELSPLAELQADQRSYVLAASAAVKQDPALTTLASFVSPELNTVVRFLQSSKDRTLNVYVIGHHSLNFERAIISFTREGVDLITDEKGKISQLNPDLVQGIDWNTAHPHIRLPRVTLSLPTEQEQASLINDQGVRMRVQPDSNEYVITIQAIGPMSRLLCVQDQESELYLLHEDLKEIRVKKNADLSLLLYH